MWYKIPGIDQAITVEVTNAEFDSRLAVFRGGCGQQLDCVASNANSSYRNYLSSVTFLTESGTDYYVLLTSSTETITNVGSYTADVTVSFIAFAFAQEEATHYSYS